MDDAVTSLLRRLVRRIPAQNLKTTLEKWGRLTEEQLQSVDFTQSKWALTQNLLAFSEENAWTLKHITQLELTYVIDSPDVGMWHTFQLMDPDDDAQNVELIEFRDQFKSHLRKLVTHVSVRMKKHTDESVWIRIAWADRFGRPNNMKPTYVVHHLQTPYVFVSSLTPRQKPPLSQALLLATKHYALKDANLSGRRLTALRELLTRQFEQAFPRKPLNPFSEITQTVLNPLIETEHAEPEGKRRQMACEAFGEGKLPELQSVVYKLETNFKDHTNNIMMERDTPFRCVVRFSGSNVLESLRHCASSGVASTPMTPLLSSISLKARNYFIVTENDP